MMISYRHISGCTQVFFVVSSLSHDGTAGIILGSNSLFTERVAEIADQPFHPTGLRLSEALGLAG